MGNIYKKRNILKLLHKFIFFTGVFYVKWCLSDESVRVRVPMTSTLNKNYIYREILEFHYIFLFDLLVKCSVKNVFPKC